MNHEHPATPVRIESKHPEFRLVSAGHFTEDADYSTWRDSGTDDWLLIQTVSGFGRIGGTRSETTTSAGDAVLIPPGRRHDYATARGADGWELLFAHFRPPADWSAMLDWPGHRGEFGVIHLDGEVLTRVTSALRRCSRMVRSPFASAELFAMNALEEALLWIDTQNSRSSPTDDRILRVVEYVDAHLADRLDVSVLAEVGSLSSSRLTHLFTETLGISPQKYVERQRLQTAQQLLDFTNRPIAVIARDVGWEDALYFSQRFRRFTGLSPSRFRVRK